MSTLLYAVHFMCDVCYKKADAPAPLVDSYNSVTKATLPEGWHDMINLSVSLRDTYGTNIQHLCPECGKLGVGEIADKLKVKFD